MKLTLPSLLKKALLTAVLGIFSINAYAETFDVTSSADRTDFANAVAGDIINVNLTGDSNDWLGDAFTVADGVTVYIQQWDVVNGSSHKTYTFDGTIVDHPDTTQPGNIEFNSWRDETSTATDFTANNKYVFNGDMSGFSGDILAPGGGLNLEFGGGERESIAGTGAISIYTPGKVQGNIVFNAADGGATITNSSISANALSFNGNSSTYYHVGANDTATAISAQSLTVAAGTTINMRAGSSLNVTGSAIAASEGNFNFADNSSMTALNGSQMGNLMIEGSVTFNLSLGGETALTTDVLSFADGASLTLNTEILGAQLEGTPYTLVDADNDLDVSLLDYFTINTNAGAPAYTIEIVDGNLVLRIDAASKAIIWGGGSGDWDTTATNWGDDTTTFVNTDFVTFANSSADTEIISIDTDVYPAGITVEGTGDTTFDGSAGIAGTSTLLKNGTGTLTIMTSNSFTGGTTINEGTVIMGVENALGTGPVTVAADATLGLGYAGAMGDLANVTMTAGSSFLIDRDVAFTDAMSNKITTGITLKVADGVTASIDPGSTYTSGTTGYTIELGNGATLENNIIKSLSGGTTTVKGSTAEGMGIYEIVGLRLGAGSTATTIFNVEAGATVKVTGTNLSTVGGNGSFMLSNYGANDVINISGVLDIASGVSNRDGTGTININDGGEFIMRRGLAAVSNSATRSDITINVENGGTLTLFSKDTSGAELQGNGNGIIVPTVNIKDGATIKAGEAGTTVVADQLSYAAGANVTFDVASSAQVLEMSQAISLQTATIQGEGTLKGSSLTLSNGTNTITITGSGANSLFSITAKPEITRSVPTRTLSADRIDNVDITDASLTGTGADTIISNSTISNSSLTNLHIENVAVSNTTLTSVSINAANVTLGPGVELIDTSVSGLTVTQVGETTFTNNQEIETTALTFRVAGLIADTIKGSLTLDLGDLDLLSSGEDTFTARYDAGEIIAFELDGISAADLAGLESYTDIHLIIDGVSYGALGLVYNTEGDALVYIPEPSSATLSLLALAGLLARRRRKSA